MKPIMKVSTFCKTCFMEKKDGDAKRGTAYIYQINDNAFFVQIYFKKCEHKRTAILTKEQIEKMEVK